MEENVYNVELQKIFTLTISFISQKVVPQIHQKIFNYYAENITYKNTIKLNSREQFFC